MRTLIKSRPRFCVFICILLVMPAQAHMVRLLWDASPSSNVTSYVLYCGPRSGEYVLKTNVNTCCQVTLTNAFSGRWFFMVTARDDLSGLESDPSNEVNVCFDCKPEPATNLTATVIK